MTRPTRRLLRTGLALLVLMGALVGAERWLERTVYARSIKVLADLCGPGSKVTIGSMELHLLAGDVRWSTVRMEQLADSSFGEGDDHAFHLAGTIDTVSVKGLSLGRLLFTNTVAITSLRISVPRIQLFVRADTVQREEHMPAIDALRIGAIEMTGGSLHQYHQGHSGPVTVVEQVGLHAKDIITGPLSKAPLVFRFAALTGHITGVAVSLSPLYDLAISGIMLGDGGAELLVTDASVRPTKGPESYQTIARFESDLISAHVDTIRFSGLDINACFGEHMLASAMVRATGMDIDIHRDKTMPDGPKHYMPLPLRKLAGLPFAVCVDSVLMDRWTIRYHEKGELSPDYGDLLFSDVSGTLSGLCTADTIGEGQVHLTARARVYDRAPLTVDLKASLADRGDGFTLNAKIGTLPIDVFNRMTTDLVLMEATAGHIGGIDYTLTADDHHASGRVDVEYAGLKISALKQDGSGEQNDLRSLLLNQVVHSENLRSNANFRHGDFAFDRQRDRSIFKYVWTGLREGLLAGMLPGALDTFRKSQKGAPRSSASSKKKAR